MGAGVNPLVTLFRLSQASFVIKDAAGNVKARGSRIDSNIQTMKREAQKLISNVLDGPCVQAHVEHVLNGQRSGKAHGDPLIDF